MKKLFYTVFGHAQNFVCVQIECGVIHGDKKLHRLFTAVVNYVNLQPPDFEGEVDDVFVAVTLKK